jgi:hypothetical protein
MTSSCSVAHQRLESMIKEKVSVPLDDDSLKLIIDLVAGEISSSSSSHSTNINIIDMYKNDSAFCSLMSLLNKNEALYFEACVSECTVFDATTGMRSSSNMMAVRAKTKLPANVKFGFLSGHVISRVEFEMHKNVRYKTYADSLRALPVGLDRVLLVDFDCLGAFINSASSTYKSTQYRSLPLVMKVRMVQSTKWPGVFYFQTMQDFVIHEGEEIHTLYVDGQHEEASVGDDDAEANRVSLTDESDDEDIDPSISLSQL